jgi:hypothetical protein
MPVHSCGVALKTLFESLLIFEGIAGESIETGQRRQMSRCLLLFYTFNVNLILREEVAR